MLQLRENEKSQDHKTSLGVFSASNDYGIGENFKNLWHQEKRLFSAPLEKKILNLYSISV